MALVVTNVSQDLVSVGGPSSVECLLTGAFTGNTGTISKQFRLRPTGGGVIYGPTFGNTSAPSQTFYSSTSGNPTVNADSNYEWWSTAGGEGAATLSFKSAAVTASASAPSVSSILATSASVDCNFFPNTSVSTCSAQLQYKLTSDATWTDFGSARNSTTHYAQDSMGATALTGLAGSTSYDVRIKLTRTTVNETVLLGSSTTFVTLADDPEATTVAASTVTSAGATLNATIALNNQASVNAKWVYGTSNPPVAGVGDGLEVSYASNPVTVGGSVDKSVTGLSPSTTYYFFAKVYWNSDTESNSGSVLSFMTPADPSAEAADEDHMQIFEFDRKYKTSTTVYFTVASPAATSSDRWFNAASPFVAGDIQVSIDGAAFANVGTLPTRIGTTALFSMPLTAAETEGSLIVVQIVDQDGPAFRDAIVLVRTKLDIGQINADASQIGSSASAFNLTPSAGGYGIAGTGSPDFNGAIRSSTATAGAASTITLDASASATNDYYNGCIIVTTGGTGPNQQRVIVDYDGTSKAATVHKAWSTNPASGTTFLIVPGNDLWEVSPLVELAAVPGATNGFGKLLQFVFQRFAYKRIQTATLHTMKKADSSTDFATATVADDGTTQSFSKLA